jgi:hypothetical protein
MRLAGSGGPKPLTTMQAGRRTPAGSCMPAGSAAAALTAGSDSRELPGRHPT